MDASTDHAEQLSTLTVLVTALIAKIANPTEDTSTDEANTTLADIAETARQILETAEIDTAGFSKGSEETRERIMSRIDEITTSLRFND